MKKRLLLAISVVLFCTSNYGQNALWNRTDEKSINQLEKFERASIPAQYHLFHLNLEALKTQLKNAPLRTGQLSSQVIVQFPDGNGELKNFRIYEAPVMQPDLAARYPDMKSYLGQNVENPSETISFSITLFGLHNMMFSGGDTSYTDPYTKDHQNYIVYKKASLTTPRTFSCGVTETNTPKKNNKLPLTTFSENATDGIFRTYRLAMACTIEYAAFHITEADMDGGTMVQKKAAVLAAMNVTVTRVNSIYERDLAITLQLVADNDDIIFITDDEFDNENEDYILLDQSQEVIDDVIGLTNYDIGHTVSTGGGGVAQMYSPCSGSKARGITGLWAPVGDPFDIDFVAHEMGHQFGGNHTFNNDCGDNRNDDTAYEPGSGNTIMAYAGVCSPSVQDHSDAHFHRVSIEEMTDFINNWADCSENINTGNAVPVINAGIDYTIPKGTAFILNGTATDADADDMTYCWEQMDRQVSVQPPVASAVSGPNFRSMPPKETTERYMPDLNSVLANNLAPEWEVISNVARTFHFSFTVRDNNPLGGQVVYDDMQVSVSGVAGPFLVLTPNTNVSWQAGTSQTVTWDVAGTTANGVNAATVDILLSNDGGFTYPVTLANGVTNDGSEAITVPNNPGTNKRIMVKGHNHIFYDLSNTNFTITPPPGTMNISVAGNAEKTTCKGGEVAYAIAYTTEGDFTAATTFSITGNPAGSTVTFNPASITAAGNVTVTVTTTTASIPGDYMLTVTATSGTTIKTAALDFELFDNNFGDMVLTLPANNAVTVLHDVEFEWDASILAINYLIEIATDAAFENIVATQEVNTNTHEATLADEGDYYWRVKPFNDNCEGAVSDAFKFIIEEVSGVNDNTLTNFSLYPNPNKGEFTVKFNSVTGSEIKMAVYDMRGRQLLNESFANTGLIEQSVSLGGAQAGVYLVSIRDGDAIMTKKIIIE